MQIQAKLLDNSNAIIEANIKEEKIKQNIEKLAKKASKTMKIDGFRKGHIPLAIVHKRLGQDLKRQAEQEILKEALDQGIMDLKKRTDELIGEPIITKFDNANDLNVEMSLSFKPLVELDGYEKLIPNFSNPKVTKKEVEEKRNEILKRMSPLKVSDKKTLENGDFAKFDFEGYINDVAFDGGKAENYVLEIGSKQFIPGFEDQMIGLSVGQNKDINLKFPENYQAQHLAGKDVVFKIKLHEIQVKEIITEPNEEMLKQLLPNAKNPSLEILDSEIKQQIKQEKLNKLLNDELKPTFAKTLVETYIFDLPKNIVEQEIDVQFRNALSIMSQEEIDKLKDNQEAIDKKREEFRKDASDSVALTFIIDELARLRSVKVSDQELIQAIYLEAYGSGKDPKQALEFYKNQGLLPAIKMSMIEEKLFNEIFNKEDEENIEETEKPEKKNVKKSENKSEKTEKKSTKKAK